MSHIADVICNDRGFPLFLAALAAPLIACRPETPHELHAVTMQGVVRAWPKEAGGPEAFATAACGEEGMKLTQGEWPPRVASLPDGWTRCRKCHVATGRQRPRCAFVITAK